MDGIRIRDAVMSDREALADLYRRSSLSNEGDRDLLRAHPEALELDAHATDEGRTRVAWSDAHGDAIAGFSSAAIAGDVVELEALFVDPDRMRLGVGRALVEDAAARARALGLVAVEVTGNDHALAFYLATGFEVTGTTDTPLGVTALRLRRRVEPT